MMGLDIFTNMGTQPVPAASRSSCTDPTSSSRESGQHGYGGAGVREACSSGAADSKGPVPQHQGETDFRDMLENFFSTFEQDINGCAGAVDVESQTGSLAGHAQAETQTPPGSRRLEPAAHRAARAKCSKKNVPKKPQKKRASKKYALSPQKRQESAPSSGPNVIKFQERENRQLQLMPVVKLERRVPLPDRVILQGTRLQNLSNKVSVIPPLLLTTLLTQR